MDIREIWGILGIQETKNEEEIKEAYRDKIVHVNPEDDAEGFMRLRSAYEMAIRYINEPDQEATGSAKNDVDSWIDRVNAVYSSLEKRRKEEYWEELFKDDICTGLDTSTEAREKLLVFLMDNHYLPQKVWILIEKEFDIIADKEQLYEIFPRNFIDYVVNQITLGGFLDFSLFTTSEGENADEYINTYFRLKADIDEGRLDDCQKILDDLERYETYYPYKDVEKIRYYLLTERLNEAVKLAESIIAWYSDDVYIICAYAKVKSSQNQYDAATKLYKQALERFPDYYIAKVGLMECLFDKENYTEAKEIALELINQYHHNEIAREYMVKSNEKLIEKLKEEVKTSQDCKTKMELAWCLYQNERYEESITLLEEVPLDVRNEYDFINLHGRAYLAAGEFEQAIDKLKVWLDAILNTPRDDSEESKVRYNRLGYAYYSIGLCYSNLEEYDLAEDYLRKSIEVEDKLNDKLMSMERLAYTYLKANRFQECIKCCEEILDISKDYYPAYLYRQEANFELGNDQEVINDYHRSIEIYPGYIRPYLFAIKVFIRHNQLKDAQDVADAAKNAGLDSNELKLLCIRIIRLKENEKDERHEAIQQCIKLKKLLQSEDNDIKEPVSVDFEMAMLHVQNNDYDQAIAIMNSIIKARPSEDYYIYIKGLLFKDIEKYQAAIVIFKDLIKRNPENEKLYYEIGCCYFGLNQMDKALEYLQKFIEMNPDHSQAHDANDKIVDIYRDKIRDNSDIEYYHKALPYADMLLEGVQNSYTYNSRGLLHLDAYEFEKALADFYNSLNYSPDDWIVINNAGYTYLLMRDMDKAIEELKRSEALIPIDKTRLPYNNLARSYYIMKNYDESLKYYLMLHKTYPVIEDYIEHICDIFNIKGDLKNSILWTNKLREIEDYSEANIYNRLAEIYFFHGKMRKANKFYKKSLTPNRLRSYYKYAFFLISRKDFTSALFYIRKAASYADPKNSDYIDICRLIADVYWSVKAYNRKLSDKQKITYEKEAYKYAELSFQAISKHYESIEKYCGYPKDRVKSLVDVAYLYTFLGDLEKAEYYIQKALHCPLCNTCYYSKCLDAYEVLGMVYEERNQLDKALECYETIVNNDPCYITALIRLENIREKLKG